MNTIALGDIEISRMGLGTNRIQDNEQSREILRYAVERGVQLIDTAHLYTGGVSERIIGETLAPYADGVVVASKGGMYGGAPSVLREQLEQSLKSLKTDSIALYYLHRVDPGVPIEESVGALRRFQEEGKIQQIGISDVSLAQIKQAQAVAPLAAVQNHYNVAERGDDAVVDYCEEQGIVFFPFYPLGGRRGDERLDQRLEALATKYKVSVQQMGLAWLLKRSPATLPIPGTLSKEHLDENMQALHIPLSDEDFASL